MNDLVKAVFLKDYQVPTHLIKETFLDIHIDESHTIVTSRLVMQRNPASEETDAPLILHGGSMLSLVYVKLNGNSLSAGDYQLSHGDLILPEPQLGSEQTAADSQHFIVETQCLIKPQDNTHLEGLYQSGGMFCTQCEPEGFRNITFYLDRPDVLSVFTTRISAPKAKYPVLLANGNPIESGDELEVSGEIDNVPARHFSVWRDPFPKPAYLFAMVAGDLVCQEDSFTTQSGREVALTIFVEAHNSHKCDHAMASLRRSMLWDEQRYGREYDLDLFMIVAVDDFNMGAMENKGLNIFNSDCVLADPATTTDGTFERIEGIVAHEYFHNWSGNRVTCRDWFQLSLKEGFTVFRDSQYTADTYSATVKRIDDVSLLRTAQFAEDGGPMAHPVQPASYMEINNFYSVTVYEKGAEVVGMIHTLLGEELFRQGSDLYFARHDGQAVTIEDFVYAMESTSGMSLSQFKYWYSQAGTPTLTVQDEWDAATGRYTLYVTQTTPATPESATKLPFHIPLRLAFFDGKGQALAINWPDNSTAISQDNTEAVVSITDTQQHFSFANMPAKTTPSLLRGFSAPVKLDYAYTQEQLLFLAKHDNDGFNRWEATQRLLLQVLNKVLGGEVAEQAMSADLLALLADYLNDTQLDPAMAARLLQLPSEAYLAENQQQVDVDGIHHSRSTVRKLIAEKLHSLLLTCYQRNHDEGEFLQSGQAIGRRALKNTCLLYLVEQKSPSISTLAQAQYLAQANMTDVHAALHALIAMDIADEQLADFYQRWQHDVQVVDQWLGIQASVNQPKRLEKVKSLMGHKAFDMRNPNKVRRVIGGFMSSPINFHQQDGSGYTFVADQVIVLNDINPMMAAALCKPLGRFKKHNPTRQQIMRHALEKIMANNPCNDVYEVASKALAQ